MNFRLQFNWVDAGPSPDVVMRRTMARFSIEVDGKTLTAVRDRQSRRYRKQIVVPLFSVANWLVDNWWYLWHEPADIQNLKPGFEDRHNLAYAGHGFLLPKLTIAPLSDRIHLVSTPWEPVHSSISFIEDMDAYVEAEELQMEFQRLINSVLRRLEPFDDNEDKIQLSKAWHAINELDAKELEFSRAAAMCGIDPFDVEDSTSEAIIEFWESTQPSIREEALAASNVQSLSQLSHWIRGTVNDLATTGEINGWNRIRDEIRNEVSDSHTKEPWKRGYYLAQSVREILDIGQNKFQFKSEGPLAIYHKERESPSQGIEGLVASATPACITAPRNHSNSKRFLLARALGEFVGCQEPCLGILGTLQNDRQARSRAFAAELLAPAELLYSRYMDSDAPQDEVDELSRAFDVSIWVIEHQIENYVRTINAAPITPLQLHYNSTTGCLGSIFNNSIVRAGE